jgi:hypothetical protein
MVLNVLGLCMCRIMTTKDASVLMVLKAPVLTPPVV